MPPFVAFTSVNVDVNVPEITLNTTAGQTATDFINDELLANDALDSATAEETLQLITAITEVFDDKCVFVVCFSTALHYVKMPPCTVCRCPTVNYYSTVVQSTIQAKQDSMVFLACFWKQLRSLFLSKCTFGDKHLST